MLQCERRNYPCTKGSIFKGQATLFTGWC